MLTHTQELDHLHASKKERKEKEKTQSKLRVMEVVDLISNLLDALLAAIVCFLPGMEGVSTTVLSQRCKMAWKYSSHLGRDKKK